MIKWINEKNKEGAASLYETNVTLNAVAALPFETVEYVRFGVNEFGDLLIAPVSNEEYGRGVIDKSTCYKAVSHKSYARISSTGLMRSIAEECKLQLSSKPLQFPCVWNEKENYLEIKIGGNVNA